MIRPLYILLTIAAAIIVVKLLCKVGRRIGLQWVLTLLFVWVIPWLAIWGAFGASNQLMAGLALLLIALWLKSEKRKNTWALYPAIFMIVTDLAALIFLAYGNFKKLANPEITTQGFIASVLLGIIAVVLIIAAAILIMDGWKALRAPTKAAAEVT